MKTNYKFETNPRVERLEYRERVLSCSYCKANQSENQKRKSKVRKFDVLNQRPWDWWWKSTHVSWKLYKHKRRQYGVVDKW